MAYVSGEDSVYSEDEYDGETVQKNILQDSSDTISGDSSDIDSKGKDGNWRSSKKKCCSWISQCRENWRRILAIMCLWTAYVLCSAAYSLMNPFFPQVVSARVAIII